MRLSRYEIFLAVVELGSLTSAAEHFNYSQSAISQIINSLESEFGVSLLSRNRSGAMLTQEGKQLYPYICDLGNSFKSLSDQVAVLTNLQVGTIRIGVFTSVACNWIPAMIIGFQKLYPNIKFDILQGTYGKIEEWIQNGMADIGFSVRHDVKGLDSVPIYLDSLMVIIPEDHPYAKEDYFPFEKLSEYPFIYISEGDEDILKKMFEENNIHPDIRYYVKNDYTVMAMVESGMGIGIVPSLMLRRNPYNIVQKPTRPLYSRNISIVLRDKNKASPATKRFLQYIIENHFNQE